MQRRTFLRNSAAGIGALTGLYENPLKAEVLDKRSVPSAASLGHDFSDVREAGRLTWGTNSAVLKSPWSATPSLDDLLTDRERTLRLDRFYRVGRDDRPATPTSCNVAYSSDALFVVFQCSEIDTKFPHASLDPELWSQVSWASLNGLPSGAASSWPPNPDEVDILIQPDPKVRSFYQFAATPQGAKFGCRRVLFSDEGSSPDEASAVRNSSHVTQIKAFKASIVNRANEWLVLFQIPWQSLGGRPNSHFGILPMRTRWRDAECSSPVALDLNESLPVDLLIETHFSPAPQTTESQTSLCRLPSGILRWQTPAAPTYPDRDTRQEIWQMQSSLTAPTDEKSLNQRLYLTQRWMDLLMLEGFTPLRTGWGLLTNDLTLTFIRQKINSALQIGDVPSACKLLDAYLVQLDSMSRWWYADGSPGNIANDKWTRVDSVVSLEVQGSSLLMTCAAGPHNVDLRLALPATGGVRIYGKNEGYWRPGDYFPLDLNQTSNSWTIKTVDGEIVIGKKPLSISIFNAHNTKVMEIKGEGLAFLFGSSAEILATDFRYALAPNEAVYGFGEQYNRFNQNGNVLTLWGADDTFGNGKGLANATYKPLPIFHSTKPYMVFSNSSYRLRADIGKTDPAQCRLTQHGPIFDYYFWVTAPEKSLESYTALTGRPPLPPKWVFEPWMGRGGGAWAENEIKDSLAWSLGETGAAVSEEKRVIERFAELDIPHSAIYAEGPSALSTDLNQFLANRGIRALGYFRPEIGPKRQQALMPELKPTDLPVLRCKTEEQTRALEYVDFTNPQALELCRRALRREAEIGLAGSMVDFGDWVPDDATFHDGKLGNEMHNFYSYDYHRTISQVFRERRGDDFILYARAAAPGTQRWLGQFAGDHPSNFDGLKHVLTGALNLCACGYSTWGSDIGGYFGFPQPAVYMRWVQFGCFSPLMRPHGIAPREPWYYGEAAVSNYKFFAWTRENLLDYTQNAAVVASRTGLPIIRSMPLAYPNEPGLAAISDQYMFGPDLLVAPVVNEGESRVVAFPSGAWTSLWDGKNVSGPAMQKVSAPMGTIPVYLKAGAVAPVQLGRTLKLGESMTPGRFQALVVTLNNENSVVSLVNAHGENATVAVQSGDNGGGWTLKNLPEIEFMLIYGVSAASAVIVNDFALQKVQPTQLAADQFGWAADPISNRLIVRLPRRKAEQSMPVDRIELRLAPNSKQERQSKNP